MHTCDRLGWELCLCPKISSAAAREGDKLWRFTYFNKYLLSTYHVYIRYYSYTEILALTSWWQMEINYVQIYNIMLGNNNAIKKQSRSGDQL